MKSFSGKDLEIAKAISEWMQTHNLNTSLESFLKETSISQDDIPKTKILEKKWTTILTMQKKVTDLEQKLKNVKEEYEQASISGLSYSTKNEISNGIMVGDNYNKYSYYYFNDKIGSTKSSRKTLCYCS